ncbi:MAG: acyl carrier protein [Planctomycetes bacterium]|nr:acyl carrier protein [Planctomycetota bacterium]
MSRVSPRAGRSITSTDERAEDGAPWPRAGPSRTLGRVDDLARVTDRILELTRARFRLDAGALRPDDDLFQALGVDSVQALDLLSALELELGVELPDYELAEVRSFADLARKVRERL